MKRVPLHTHSHAHNTGLLYFRVLINISFSWNLNINTLFPPKSYLISWQNQQESQKQTESHIAICEGNPQPDTV